MCIHSDYLVIENVAGIHQCEDECLVRQPDCKGIVKMLKTCALRGLTKTALGRALVHPRFMFKKLQLRFQTLSYFNHTKGLPIQRQIIRIFQIDVS